MKNKKTTRRVTNWRNDQQPTDKPPVQVFEDTGATRAPVEEHMHYLCPEFELGIARICAEGFKAYPDAEALYAELSTGRRGLSKANLIKHGNRHWALYRKADRTEDHLSKVGWALMMLKHFECEPVCQHFNFLLEEEEHLTFVPKGFSKKNKELYK